MPVLGEDFNVCAYSKQVPAPSGIMVTGSVGDATKGAVAVFKAEE